MNSVGSQGGLRSPTPRVPLRTSSIANLRLLPTKPAHAAHLELAKVVPSLAARERLFR